MEAPDSCETKDAKSNGQLYQFDEDLSGLGCKMHPIRRILIWPCYILTVGLLRLLFYWLPDLYRRVVFVPVDLQFATHVFLCDRFGNWDYRSIQTVLLPDNAKDDSIVGSFGLITTSPNDGQSIMRFFTFRKVRYLYVQKLNTFRFVSGLEERVPLQWFHRCGFVSGEAQLMRLMIFGANCIDVHVKPVIKLLITDILSPFYVFQWFSVCLWIYEVYYYYAGCIFAMSIVSIVLSIIQTRAMQRKLKHTVRERHQVQLKRSADECEMVDSATLVPGDVVDITDCLGPVTFDGVLISGKCVLNESMLTGESVPVTKTPLPNFGNRTFDESEPMLDTKRQNHHILFCGTQVLQTRHYESEKVLVVVFRTGFNTSRGELVRSILYPRPADFKFERDSYKFMGGLAFMAMFGMVYTFVLMSRNGVDPSTIVVRALDLITVVIPPALPAAMTFGILFAQRRLRLGQIYCISPRRINVSGSLNLICFDKTGTLTEDGLDFKGVRLAHGGTFSPLRDSVDRVTRSSCLEAMVSCHSLTYIDDRLQGDPLDMKMFEATGWELAEARFEDSSAEIVTVARPPAIKSEHADDLSLPYEVGIICQFQFSSSLQRMSVVARVLGDRQFNLYAKGSPEMISSLCKPETVPDNFHDVLVSYTRHGYRVLALAWRRLDASVSFVKVRKLKRENVECDLTFIGFLIMENRLKPETTPSIDHLHRAHITTVMVTGDNLLTGISVANDCHLIEENEKLVLVQADTSKEEANGVPEIVFYSFSDASMRECSRSNAFDVCDVGVSLSLNVGNAGQDYVFAMQGATWGVICKHYADTLLPKILVRGRVFARMSPDQKQQLVEEYQKMGYCVGMCGDGANDCGALKTAHAGISLSEAEASVASPFTSKVANISCVITLAREGRAALVSSYGIFKFMAGYSLTQFMSCLILYSIACNLTDFEFLYIDLFTVTPLSFTYGYTAAWRRLAPKHPDVQLLSIRTVTSVVLHLAVTTAAQVFGFLYVQQQPWFPSGQYSQLQDNFSSYENYSVWVLSLYHYIWLAVIYSKGPPYRNHFFTNYAFMINLIVVSVWTFINILFPTQPLQDWFKLKVPDYIEYRGILLGVAVFGMLVSLAIERTIIDYCCSVDFWSVRKWKMIKSRYELVEDELGGQLWPPLTFPSKTELEGLMKRLMSSAPPTPTTPHGPVGAEGPFGASGGVDESSSEDDLDADDPADRLVTVADGDKRHAGFERDSHV